MAWSWYCRQDPIAVLPLYTNFGGEGYLDDVEVSREEFYSRLPESDPAPTTALPRLRRFIQAYENLTVEGATPCSTPARPA